MIHTLVDPFAVDPAELKARERMTVRRTVGVLSAELDRLEARIDRLYRQQSALPEGGCEEEWNHWDDVWNDYDRRISRLVKRSDAIANTIFDLEARLYWELS